LEESKETFLSLDQLLDESPLKLLSNSEKLVKALPLVTESEGLLFINFYSNKFSRKQGNQKISSK